MQTATLSPAAARQGITQNGLKLLALCLMLLDHIYYFFGFTGAIPLVFTWLGRLSAWWRAGPIPAAKRAISCASGCWGQAWALCSMPAF